MSNFRYYNRNPDGKHLEDCVCRAISTVSGMKYETVEQLLKATAIEYDCPELCVCCYHNLIEEMLGYELLDEWGMTAGEFAKAHPKGTYLLRMDGHITTCIDGEIWDIWNCSRRIVTHCWYVG